MLDVNSDGSFVKYVNGLGIDDKIRQTVNGQVLYFVQDHLGSTNALTDATGNVVSSATYDSFGNASGNLATRYGYTGREKDADTGLYYYRARWYDSNLGRFLSEDPIGFAGGDVNLFAYVGGNPANFNDPVGLEVIAVFNRQARQLNILSIGGGGSFEPVFESRQFEGLFSGKICENQTNCDAEKEGPIPAGTYLIDKTPDDRFNDWRKISYRLYRSQNDADPLNGPFEDDYAPVKDPFTGKTTNRGGFYIHPGSLTEGCITFLADGYDSNGIPYDDEFNVLSGIFKKTSPYKYKEQNYAGVLFVW